MQTQVRNNIVKTYTIPKEVVSRFEEVCRKDMRKYSTVIQRLMMRYCEGK